MTFLDSYGGGADVALAETIEPYDNVKQPVEKGSGGGNGGGTGGSGGGLLHWKVGTNIEIDGLLSLKGADGSGSHAAGGSGGSLYIETMTMTGHGEINVRGGDGVNQGGGGAGGRIGIACQFRYWFGGDFVNRGGAGAGSYDLTRGAAAGTAYVANQNRPLSYRELKYHPGTNHTYFQVDHQYIHIDNEGRDVEVATLVMQDQQVLLEFDEMELTGYARLLFFHPTDAELVTVIVHRFIGDKTGKAHLRSDQLIYVEYIESESNVTEAPCSYQIDDGAEIVLPTEVRFHGVDTYLYGQVTNVHHLYVEDNAYVEIASTTQTAAIENNTVTHISDAGNLEFPSINIRNGATFALRRVTDDIFIDAPWFEVKFGGTVEMNHGHIESSFFDVEFTAQIDLIGRGNAAQQGPGASTSKH